MTKHDALRWLSDRIEIRDCVHRYARGLDRHDEDILRSVFHADAIDNHGAWIGHVEEFIEWGNDWHANVTLAHMHNMNSHFAEIDGDEAHALTYVVFVLCRPDGRTVHWGGGRYFDRLERREGAWLIALRRFIVDWRFDVANDALPERVARLPRGTWDRSDPTFRTLHLPAA